MRMECSSLKNNLYRKNIVPDPSCQCGGFESPHHFFFCGLKYSAARNRYLPSDIYKYNANDFLFGRDNMTDHENEALFVKIQDYIIKSGRFT